MKALSTLILILTLAIGGLQAQTPTTSSTTVDKAVPVETKASAASLPDATMETTGTEEVKAKSCHGSTEGKKSCCSKSKGESHSCAGKSEETKASGCSHGHGSTSTAASIPDAKKTTEVAPRDEE